MRAMVSDKVIEDRVGEWATELVTEWRDLAQRVRELFNEGLVKQVSE